MNKDKALEELFLAQKPHFDDSEAFMASLTKRLDAVEYIKQHQEATIRRYKMAMLVALVVGIISGAFTMALILSTPLDVPLFSFLGAKSDNHVVAGLLWLSENSRLMTAALLSVLITLGMISIVNNVQEIKAMRYSLGNLQIKSSADVSQKLESM
ncbi:MAG: hypothetical protein IKW97_07375 [Muribaculaceae bacterium]|nr:hypothetical protein [Muribaculaceae bacterium]